MRYFSDWMRLYEQGWRDCFEFYFAFDLRLVRFYRFSFPVVFLVAAAAVLVLVVSSWIVGGWHGKNDKVRVSCYSFCH